MEFYIRVIQRSWIFRYDIDLRLFYKSHCLLCCTFAHQAGSRLVRCMLLNVASGLGVICWYLPWVPSFLAPLTSCFSQSGLKLTDSEMMTFADSA